MSMPEDMLEEALADVVRSARDAGATRALLSPQGIALDTRHERIGRFSDAVVLGPERFALLRQSVGEEGAALKDGTHVQVLGGHVLLTLPGDGLKVSQALAAAEAEGRLSSLGFRLIAASLSLGHNILMTGPRDAAAEIVLAIAAAGKRPAFIGEGPCPSGWLKLTSAQQALSAGVDRLAALQNESADVWRTLRDASGVVAWICAGTLPRALMRLEGAAARVEGAANPVHVLSAVDLVIEVKALEGARVASVTQIVMEGEGYRPRVLMACGYAPLPYALVPLQQPTFLDALGPEHVLLVEELRHACPTSTEDSGSPDVAPPVEPSREDLPAAMISPPPAPIAVYATSEAPPPGWELDQHEATMVTGDDYAAPTEDDAAMAALYGLQPPPVPRGTKPAHFGQALEEARARDASLREDDAISEYSDDD